MVSFLKFGANCRVRTDDLLITSELLWPAELSWLFLMYSNYNY